MEVGALAARALDDEGVDFKFTGGKRVFEDIGNHERLGGCGFIAQQLELDASRPMTRLMRRAPEAVVTDLVEASGEYVE